MAAVYHDVNYLVKLSKIWSARFRFVFKLAQHSAANHNRHCFQPISRKTKPNGHLAYPHFPSLTKGCTFPALETGGTIFVRALIGLSRYCVCFDWLDVMTLVLV